MIAEDFRIAEKIFNLLDEGILDNYDSFKFIAEVYSNYIETELLVTSGGAEVADPKVDFNGSILYELVKELKKNFSDRGENWRSFTISYSKGGKVKTYFEY